MPEDKIPIPEFAAKIKAKYPAYKDMNDTLLTQKIIEKYPEYKDQVDLSGLSVDKEGALGGAGAAAIGSPIGIGSNVGRTGVIGNALSSAGKVIEINQEDDPIKYALQPYREAQQKAQNDYNQSLLPQDLTDKSFQIPNAAKPDVIEKKSNLDASNKALNNALEQSNYLFGTTSNALNFLQKAYKKYNGQLPKDNETVNLALQKVAKSQAIDEAWNKTKDFTNMAANLMEGKNADGMGEAKTGQYIYDVLQSPEVQDKAKNDAEFNQAYLTAKANLYNHYPSFANKKMGQDLGQVMEDNKMINSLYDNPGTEKTDKAAQMLLDNGKWTDREMNYYKRVIRPIVEAGHADRIIPLTDIAHQTGYAAYRGVEAYNKSIRGALNFLGGNFLDKEGNSIWQNLGLLENEQNRKQREEEEQFSTPNVEPKGWKSVVEKPLTMAASVAPMILGQVMGVPEEINMALQFGSGNQDRAEQLFKGDDIKSRVQRLEYTLLGTTLDTYLMKILPSSKALVAKKELEPEIEKTISSLASGDISRADIKPTILQAIGNYMKQVPKSAINTANVLTAYQYLHKGLDAASGDRNLQEEENGRNIADDYMTNLLAGSGLSLIGALGESKGKQPTLDGKVLQEYAENYDAVKNLLSQRLREHPEEAPIIQDKLTNLDHIKSISDELDNNQDLNDNQKQRFIASSLKEKVLKKQKEDAMNKAAAIDNEVLRKQALEKITSLDRNISQSKQTQEDILKEKPTVQSAVVEIGGKIYEGKNHAEAILKAKEEGQDISKVDRQAEGKFRLSDGSIIDRAEAKSRFGEDHAEQLIEQDETSKKANEDYAAETTGQVAPEDKITVGDMIDKVGTYKGERGHFYQDGQTVVFKVEGKPKEYELGNVDELRNTPISDFDIQHEQSVITTDDEGNILVRGKKYVNNYSNPLAAINYDKDGNVISVTLDTPEGQKRTFRGNIGEDLAYQIHLKEISKDNETKQQFEQFINEDAEAKQTMDNAGLPEVAETKTTPTDEEVQREKIEPTIKEQAPVSIGEKEIAEQKPSTVLSRGDVEKVKGTKVADKEGNPIVVYHGSGRRGKNGGVIEKFDESMVSKNEIDFPVNGFFFAGRKGEAEIYGGDKNTGSYYVDIKNPASRADVEEAVNEARNHPDYDKEKGEFHNPTLVRKILIEKGFDGYIPTPFGKPNMAKLEGGEVVKFDGKYFKYDKAKDEVLEFDDRGNAENLGSRDALDVMSLDEFKQQYSEKGIFIAFKPDQIHPIKDQHISPNIETPSTEVPKEQSQEVAPTPEEKTPAAEDIKAAIYSKYPPTNINYMGTGKLETEFGIKERTPTERKRDIYTIKEADELLDNGWDIGKELNKIDSGQKTFISDAEYVNFTRYAAELSDRLRKIKDVNSPEYDRTLNELTRVANAANLSGKESARSLSLRGRFSTVPQGSYGEYMLTEMIANNDAPLTDNQKRVANEEFEKLDAATKKLEEDTKSFEEKVAAFRAEQELAKIKKETNKSKRRTHEQLVRERDDIIKNIGEKWKSAGKDILSSDIPYRKQLAAIAPDVLKLAKNLVEDGILKLEEVVKNIHDKLKDVIPDIEQKDVHDIIAGEYNEVRPTRKEAAVNYENLKQQAALINKLERAESGRTKTNKQEVRKNQEIYKLKKELGIDRLEELQALKSRIHSETQKALKQLQEGKFEPEIKKTPLMEDKELQKRFPKDFKQTQKSLDDYIKIKREVALRRLKQMAENKTPEERAVEVFSKTLNIPRTLMASFDFSAPLRQGIIASIAHPRMASRALKFMFEAAKDEKVYNRWINQVHESSRWEIAAKTGLGITDPESLHVRQAEEAFQGAPYAEQIPLVGLGVKASERAYIGYLNHLRWSLFNMYADRFENKGKTYENSPKLYEGLSSFINSETGRGGIKGLEGAAPILNWFLFASKLIASRLNMLGLSDIPNLVVRGATFGKYGLDYGFYSRLPKELRVEAAKDMLKFVAVGVATLILARQLGLQVELDPRSSDFGKIRAGNTRWDIWGGFQPYARVITQVVSGERKSTTTGKVYELKGKGFMGENRLSPLATFARQKLAPIPGTLWDLASHRDAVGQPVTVGNKLLQDVTPLFISDVVQGVKDQGVKALFTVGIPSAFGVGVQTYFPTPKKKK